MRNRERECGEGSVGALRTNLWPRRACTLENSTRTKSCGEKRGVLKEVEARIMRDGLVRRSGAIYERNIKMSEPEEKGINIRVMRYSLSLFPASSRESLSRYARMSGRKSESLQMDRGWRSFVGWCTRERGAENSVSRESRTNK